jgi:hypothetical protein
MEIINLRPPFRPQDAALFDLQIGPHLRLFNLSIRRLHSGRYRILAPNAFGKHAATFHPVLAEQITQAAVAAIGGHTSR